MTPETVRALNAINRAFYRERADEFDATRSRPWRGWSKLHERCGAAWPQEPSVLDVGCGNARFASFLRERLARFSYAGIDASPVALGFARRRLESLSLEETLLVEHDFLEPGPSLPPELAARRYDLIALFGVLHHVPAREHRARLVEELSQRLTASGQLALSLWRLLDFERFRRKLLPWESVLASSPLPFSIADLEPGDVVMKWGSDPNAQSLRYCHHVDDAEARELVARARALHVVASFVAEEGMNRYLVLARKPERANADAA